jgi:dienelactone hydrolase
METSSEFEIIYSSVLSGTNNLRTIITKPKNGSKFPAVLIVGGVGCYSIDNPTQIEIQSMKLWADSLAKNGFVTMRIEKTGMGDSKGIPCKECDFNTEKQGCLDGLKKLKSLNYVDKENVFIAGFSIGGVIAPLIAQQEAVKGIIVYGTVGRNWLEYEIDNSVRQQELDGTLADAIDRFMRAEYIRLYALFVEKKQPEQVLKEYPQTAGHLLNYPMRIEYFQQVADVNIRELWMKTTAKVLAIHGSSDFVSSADEHELIKEIVNKYHPGNGNYLEAANCDHWGLTTENEVASAMQQHTGLNHMPIRYSINWLKDLF